MLAICINTTQTKVNQAKPNQFNKYRQRRFFEEHCNWNNAKQLHIENEKLRGESNRDESNSFRSSSSLTQWAYWVCQVHCMFLPVSIVNIVLSLLELNFCFVIDLSRIVVILCFLFLVNACVCAGDGAILGSYPYQSSHFFPFFFIEIHTWMDFIRFSFCSTAHYSNMQVCIARLLSTFSLFSASILFSFEILSHFSSSFSLI